MSGDKNMRWIEFFTQARKRGWIEVLIAHKAEMIDSQIRDLAEYETRFRNLQKVRIPLIGLPLSPFPLFLGINRYAGYGPGSGCIHSRELLPLPLWAAKLYDSKLVFTQEDYETPFPAEHCGPQPYSDVVIPDPDRERLSSISPTCMWSAWESSASAFDFQDRGEIGKLPLLSAPV